MREVSSFLHDNYVTRVDLNKHSHKYRNWLQAARRATGLPNNDTTFYNGLSENDHSRINGALPYKSSCFPEVVNIVHKLNLSNGDRLGCAIYIATKHILTRSQFQPRLDAGELYATRT